MFSFLERDELGWSSSYPLTNLNGNLLTNQHNNSSITRTHFSTILINNQSPVCVVSEDLIIDKLASRPASRSSGITREYELESAQEYTFSAQISF